MLLLCCYPPHIDNIGHINSGDGTAGLSRCEWQRCQPYTRVHAYNNRLLFAAVLAVFVKQAVWKIVHNTMREYETDGMAAMMIVMAMQSGFEFFFIFQSIANRSDKQS